MHTSIVKPGYAYRSIGGHQHFYAKDTVEERDQLVEDLQRSPHVTGIETCDLRVLPYIGNDRVDSSTGYKAFDLKCQGALTGCAITNTSFSNFIRGRSETHCNGHQFAYGDLQQTDLNPFELSLHAHQATRWIKQSELCESESVLLTVIFHNKKEAGRPVRVIHGAIVTDIRLKLLQRFDRCDLGLSFISKSVRVMNTMAPFYTDAIALNRKPVQLH